MYEKFYGLNSKPFQLNPDPAFYFGSSQHRRAMAYLEYGLHQNEGFIVITGEIGAGKTTLVRNLFGKLDAHEVVAAHLVNTQLDADDILRMVAAAFSLPTKGSTKADLLLSLEVFFITEASKGKRCLLMVDEAQNLTPSAVEELRMLSNFQLETHALLQSFLVGQPEFRRILQSPEMQQLRQRVIASCHIGPMDATETRGYIEHRLEHVGWTDSPRIDSDAYLAIFRASGGLPRRINSICDRLLLSGYIAEKREFTREDVEGVEKEMRDEGLAPNLSEPGIPLSDDVTPLIPSDARGNRQSGGGINAKSADFTRRLAEDCGDESISTRLARVEESLLRLERGALGALAVSAGVSDRKRVPKEPMKSSRKKAATKPQQADVDNVDPRQDLQREE